MTEVLDLAQKLGGVGFGALLVVILYGSYKGVWVWGRQLTAMEASRDFWQSAALKSLGIAETSVGLVKSQKP